MKRLYFAYGSNMSTEWLHARIPSAKAVGPAYIADKAVSFNMLDTDGSGKANLLERVGHVTWGVLYELTAADLEQLDTFEHDYIRILAPVLKPEGDSVMAEMCISPQNSLTNQ